MSNENDGAPPTQATPQAEPRESEQLQYSPEYPHYPPCSPRDRASFAYETVSKRWPVILTQVIDAIYRACDSGTYATPEAEEEGKELIRKVGKLKYNISRNAIMEPIEDDGGANIELYNSMLSFLELQQQNMWFTAPWLYAECYLYRHLRTTFAFSKHWKAFDPFRGQKERAFKEMGKGVYDLAEMMHKLDTEKEDLDINEQALEVLFSDMIQMCLWGNTVDLSLLTSLDVDHLAQLQQVGAAANSARSDLILRNDTDALWTHVRQIKNARLDIVLDNSGLELFTDMVLADFLVTHTPFFSEVVFHPKTIPWFVSDVMPADFFSLLSAMTTPHYFGQAPSPSHEQYVTSLATRWQSYVDCGVFRLSSPPGQAEGEHMGEVVQENGVDWWVGPGVYGLMDENEDGIRALEALRGSGLVVFKGDLNFRKLTADVRWPPHTQFDQAIGTLAGRFPLLALRTNKADVIVGLREGFAQELDQKDKDWRWSGKYGLICFCPGGTVAH
ncbi:DUF89-domain-containing protein [Dacryopinax primogenitus]|uniref:Sugar phosphate phosphatase n=1 Tax=Dacryopinax primogenitus (strain DJM 731) TaxID=1858805 RepID=M5G468_DACPD|nr:DUF89-domain-containing protein [Dacryopinax primogenitus]EJU00627.1 DUF89-domain-containing protein [Dacryopinax primogenitus]